MKTAYLDCFSGISGDMLIGAMIDSGIDIEIFRKEIKKIGISGFSVRTEKEKRSGISGTRFLVDIKESCHVHQRSLKDIESLITQSGLKDSVKKDIIEIFRIVAMAEAKVHNKPAVKVHFHEVGAVDSIVDIVCAAVGFDLIGAKKIYASKIPLGGGFVKCEHGTFPVPAPATVEILKGVPVVKGEVEEELVTPTGAAILKYYVSGFGAMPEMKIERSGYGAGSKDFGEIPNLFRIIVGEGLSPEKRGVSLIETNIDDMSPQVYEYLFERLFGAGALDAWLIPVTMKKMRPAVLLSVLAEKKDTEKLIGIIFSETTTLGVRILDADRRILSRRIETVKTSYGKVSVKIGLSEDGVKSVTPEYEDCKRLAKEKKVPLKNLMRAAAAAFKES